MTKPNAIYTTRNLAILTMCASILVAAIAVSVGNAPIVRDPENRGFVGNTIGSSTTTTTTTTNGQTMRDPENPYWNGATTTDSGAAGIGVGVTEQTGYRGATQGLR